jgi:hypothetical protein
MKKKTRKKKVVRRKRRVVRRNPAIPANMNNPKYVKVFKLAQMRARYFGEPFGVYAYEGMDGPTFIARKPGEWPERYGELVTLITPKGARGLRGNPYVSKILGDMKSQQLKYRGFTIILERQPNTILATWTDGDTLQSQRYSGYSFREVYEVVKDEIDDLIKPSRPGMLRGNPSNKIRVGDEVMGIMGVDGGYVGRVIRVSGKDVSYVGSDGKVRETSEYNLTKQVPPPGRFPRRNPPMYAHGMMSHRTHGLSLKQMMKLYRLVSSGNPKAVMYARRTLGIPMSESLSQVKAVVYHHILDLKGKI